MHRFDKPAPRFERLQQEIIDLLPCDDGSYRTLEDKIAFQRAKVHGMVKHASTFSEID